MTNEMTVVEEVLAKVNGVEPHEVYQKRLSAMSNKLLKAIESVLIRRGHKKGSLKFKLMVSSIDDAIEIHPDKYTEVES